MRDPRTSTALRQLAGLGRDPGPPGWTWAVAAPERAGRLALPAAACAALGATAGEAVRVVGCCRADALVLARAGAGRGFTIDRRGRTYLPAAMRDRDTGLLVGAHQQHEVVVIVATSVLERLGDVLAARWR